MIKKLVGIVLILVFALILSSCSQPSFTPEVEKQLDQLMSSSMKKYASPGMIMGIWVPGRGEWVSAKGTADRSSGRAMKVTDRFRIGSMTKTFTATVILELIGEGKLNLDDTLDKYQAWVPNAKNITIKQVLNMTSGLYNYTELPWMERKFQKDRFKVWTPKELVEIGTGHRPYFKPGKGFHYSNTNYILLGMIIEQITGNKLEEEIKIRIIDRLGLKHTTFPIGADIHGVFCHGYMLERGKFVDWTKQNISWAWAAGAMVSNIYDLKKYITAIGDGKLLKGEVQAERLSDWVAMSKKPHFSTLEYGLGVFAFGGFVGHNGGLPGYVNIAMYDPKTKATILYMLNTQPAAGDATLEIFVKTMNILFPDRKL